jgi:hypothetical protein
MVPAVTSPANNSPKDVSQETLSPLDVAVTVFAKGDAVGDHEPQVLAVDKSLDVVGV